MTLREPKKGVNFEATVRNVVTPRNMDPEEVEQAVFIAANNRFNEFEKRDPGIYFGVLDLSSNKDWGTRAAIYFTFMASAGNFWFLEARSNEYTEEDKVQFCARAKTIKMESSAKRKGGGR